VTGPAVSAAGRYRKAYELDRARGVRRTLPAERPAAHVRQLLADGATVRGIADAAGVSAGVVSRLSRGAKDRVRRDVADKLLAITMADVRARRLATGFVPNVGARRRIQALLAIGWRHEDITAYLAGAGTRTPMVLHQRGDLITPRHPRRGPRRLRRAVHAARALAPDPRPSPRSRLRPAAGLG
jgi:hypothetical protein